jgi:hypothetical protein
MRAKPAERNFALQPSEVNMSTSKQAFSVSFAVAVLAASLSSGARAEFVCNAPSTPEDKRACELARQDRPDELRLFIQRTSSIYGLYFYDYVTEANVNRWTAADRSEKARSIAAAEDRDPR